MADLSELIENGIKVAGLATAQLPNLLDWFGKNQIQIFQQGILQEHQWTYVLPAVAFVVGFYLVYTWNKAIYGLATMAIICCGLAGFIYEREVRNHDLPDLILLAGPVFWNLGLGLLFLSGLAAVAPIAAKQFKP